MACVFNCSKLCGYVSKLCIINACIKKHKILGIAKIFLDCDLCVKDKHEKRPRKVRAAEIALYNYITSQFCRQTMA